MLVDGLALPRLLVELIESGRWPSDAEVSVPGERAHALFSDERYVHLSKPPFRTIAAEWAAFSRQSGFWDHPMTAPGEIDHEQAVIIGDFGHGSDAPIVLDYRGSRLAPCVRRLKWSVLPTPGPDGRHELDNHWVLVTETFDEFAERLGLTIAT